MSVEMEPIRVVVGCDTDPDRADYGGLRFDEGCRPQVWRGVDCIPGIRDRLDRIRDDRDRPVAVTWLLRCDEQIARTEGGLAALVESRAELWRACEDAGDEIGWHPHFWRLGPSGGRWFHEVEDRGFQLNMLREAHQAFEAAWGRPPRSTRMGWYYHNNESLAELARLGVRIDFSARPYQSFAGRRDDRGAVFAGYFDWSTTGTLPYRPSRRDYRVPASERDDALDIIELPLGLLRSGWVGILSELRRAARDHSLERVLAIARGGGAPSTATIQACGPPILFKAMVRSILDRGESWVVTYFHPDELLPRKGDFVNDRLHRPDHFLKNMKALLEAGRRSGRPVHFLTASEASEVLS